MSIVKYAGLAAVAAAAVGGIGGYNLAPDQTHTGSTGAAMQMADAGHSHAKKMYKNEEMAATAHNSHHHHGVLNLTGNNLPTLDVKIHPDPKRGWNVELVTSNFKFAPQSASTAHKLGEGHGHLYVNDKKLGRVYSNWVYLGTLPHGENKITVSLNANDHNDLAVNGKPLKVTKTILVQPGS